MSALAMILTAAMVIPGDGPEKVSGEMVQGLDLQGKWKVTFLFRGQRTTGDAELVRGLLRITWLDNQKKAGMCIQGLVYEGHGNLRAGEGSLGIYDQDNNRLRICIRSDKSRPISFRDGGGGGQRLFVLHRIKSSK